MRRKSAERLTLEWQLFECEFAAFAEETPFLLEISGESLQNSPDFGIMNAIHSVFR